MKKIMSMMALTCAMMMVASAGFAAEPMKPAAEGAAPKMEEKKMEKKKPMKKAKKPAKDEMGMKKDGDMKKDMKEPAKPKM